LNPSRSITASIGRHPLRAVPQTRRLESLLLMPSWNSLTYVDNTAKAQASSLEIHGVRVTSQLSYLSSITSVSSQQILHLAVNVPSSRTTSKLLLMKAVDILSCVSKGRSGATIGVNAQPCPHNALVHTARAICSYHSLKSDCRKRKLRGLF
jgi:hypothetical protein